MKILFPSVAFIIWVISGLAFSFNWGSCNEIIYTIDGSEKYTYGEFVYQMGIEIALLLLFMYARIGVKGWVLKLVFNWIVEILLISTFFMLKNPYSINWEKVMILEVSLAGMLILYLTCWLFPGARRVIM
jgi:hypothetical protein